MKTRLLSVLLVFLLVTTAFATPIAAMPVEEPETISPSEALELRIANGFTERFCEHNGIKDAIGYQYNPLTRTWNIVASDSRIYNINPKDDVTLGRLLEYMYYVDGHHDAHMQTVGALMTVAGSVAGIVLTGGNPVAISAGILAIPSAIMLDATAHEDKNLCYSYAHKIADKLIKR